MVQKQDFTYYYTITARQKTGKQCITEVKRFSSQEKSIQLDPLS